MQHVDLASSAERMVEARQVKVVGSFAYLLARYNPWLWMQMGDPASPGTLADSASPVQAGPGGGFWSGLPMPPPLHHGSSSGLNYWPIAQNSSAGGAGFAPTYQVAGATSDGRKALRWNGNNNTVQGCGFGTAWTVPDDAPWLSSTGAKTSFLQWVRFQSVTSGAPGGTLWEIAGQGNAGLGAFINLDVFSGPVFVTTCVCDFAGVRAATKNQVSAGSDTNWHLLGIDFYGPSSHHWASDLFWDGVLIQSNSGATTGLTPFEVQMDKLELGTGLGNCNGANSYLGDLDTQDFAILPGGLAACNALTAADYALLYAGR